MFPDCKVTEIFFMCDEFSKIFDEIISEFLLTEGQFKKKHKYHRNGKMSFYLYDVDGGCRLKPNT